MQVERGKFAHRGDHAFEGCLFLEIDPDRDHVTVDDVYAKTLGGNGKICVLDASVLQRAKDLLGLDLELWLFAGDVLHRR